MVANRMRRIGAVLAPEIAQNDGQDLIKLPSVV